jgi:hypothetical protein
MSVMDRTSIIGLVLSVVMALGTNAVPSSFWDAHEGLRALVLAICAVVAVGCALYLGYLHIDWKAHYTYQFGIMIIGLLIFGGAFSWWWLESSTNNKNNTDLSNKIIISCFDGSLPDRGFEDATLHILQIMDFSSPIPVGNTFFPPGMGEINWGGEKPESVIRCNLTNFADTPVFRFSAPLLVRWIEVVKKDDGGIGARNVLHKTIITSPTFIMGNGAIESHILLM